ncbi:hypothetical protein GF314_00535 [bacterium]|nr:hypothetical protein [bacterium]
MTGVSTIRRVPTSTVMARRRGAGRAAPWKFVLAGLLVTAGLAASIQVAGEVTQLRSEIQTLRAACDEMAARQAVLAVTWNTETSRQRIMRRAERELGLVCPEEPGPILVARMVRPTTGSEVLARDRTVAGVPSALAGERP